MIAGGVIKEWNSLIIKKHPVLRGPPIKITIVSFLVKAHPHTRASRSFNDVEAVTLRRHMVYIRFYIVNDYYVKPYICYAKCVELQSMYTLQLFLLIIYTLQCSCKICILNTFCCKIYILCSLSKFCNHLLQNVYNIRDYNFTIHTQITITQI